MHRPSVFLSLLLGLFTVVPSLFWASPTDKKVVVAGSSVPRGQGTYMAGTYAVDFDQDGSSETFAIYGYAGRLRQLLTEPANVLDPSDSTTAWSFENVSIAGNNTASLLSRFQPDVSRQYAPPKTAGTEPEYVFIGLSLGNEGLPDTTDPAGVAATFISGLEALVQACLAEGYQPIVGLAYPHARYTLEKYEWLKKTNLLLNTWDFPLVNFLGVIDAGNGRWADGYFFDNGHPNFLGHRELFYAIPTSLFAAIEAGKTEVPSYPAGEGYFRLTRDPTETAPLSFEPDATMHSFTTSFRVRATATGTVAAIRSTSRPLFLVDFGPSNDDDGRATSGPDAFARHWNSWRPQPGGVAIPAGTLLNSLVGLDGLALSPAVNLEVTTSFTAANGIVNGGLNAPDGPESSLLGNLAVETATEDYFFDSGTGAFVVSGLNPSSTYSFRFFGSRSGSETRETRYTVAGSKAGIPDSPASFSPFADIVTTGVNIGSDGAYDGNDAAIGLVGEVVPTGAGEVEVEIAPDVGSNAYIGLMEVLEHGATDQFATLELRSNEIAYVAPDGREISWPVDGDNGSWYEITLAHRYAQQETLLFIDGQFAGRLRETLVPDRFVLGGPDAASGRPLSPDTADYQDWSVTRAAWTPDEVLAQFQGHLQHASLEILAPLDDPAFAEGVAVVNTAQSLSTAMLNTGNATAMGATVAPGPITGLSYARDVIELQWTDLSNSETGYVLERRLDGATAVWEEVAILLQGTEAFLDTDRFPGASYLYRIASIEADGRSPWAYSAPIAAGEDGQSYRAWAAGYFALEPRTFRIDFNTDPAPDYGTQLWNQVDSLTSTSPYLLLDSGGDNSGGTHLTLLEGFEEFRSGNGAPLADFDNDTQASFFAVTDAVQSQGAHLRLSGLNPGFSYNISLLALRGTVVAGFDYTGRYTLSGSGDPVSFEWDNGAPAGEALVEVFGLKPDAGGNLDLRITATDEPEGSVFAGISLMVVREIPSPGAFLVDFNADGSGASYPSGRVWNTIASHTDTVSTYPLLDETGSATAGVSLQLTAPFADTREGDANPPAFGTTATAEATLFKANTSSGSSLRISGLDPDRAYDLTLLARRGSAVGGFDYSGIYTLEGSSIASQTIDAAGNTLFTEFPGSFPDASGHLELTVAAGPGAGTDFPVLNLLMLHPAAFAIGKGPAAAPDDDAEGDGPDNFTEFATGLHPLQTDGYQLALKTVQADAATVSFSYPRSLSAQGADFSLWKTTNLADPQSWALETTAIHSISALDGTSATITVTTNAPSPAEPAFWRLQITPQSP
jgi:hypothetical protein